MKKLAQILILFLGICTPLLAGEAENLMEAGNQYFQNSEYEKAINIYEEISAKNFISPSLYYNLGNSYYRVNKLGKAILNYERGLKLAPNDEDLQYNLSIAKSRTVDKIKEVPKIFVTQWFDVILSSLTVSQWSTLVVVLYIIFLAALLIFFLARRGRYRRAGFYGGSVSFVILLLSVVLLISSQNRVRLPALIL